MQPKETIAHYVQDGKLHEQEKSTIWPKETMAHHVHDRSSTKKREAWWPKVKIAKFPQDVKLHEKTKSIKWPRETTRIFLKLQAP